MATLGVEQVSEKDSIMIVDNGGLPDPFKKYIGKELIVRFVDENDGALYAKHPATRKEFQLFEGEFAFFDESNYINHKSKLKI